MVDFLNWRLRDEAIHLKSHPTRQVQVAYAKGVEFQRVGRAMAAVSGFGGLMMA